MALTRRRLLATAGALPLAARAAPAIQTASKAGRAGFTHGVASGDPLPDRVVLWTRVTPPEPRHVRVGWTLYADPGLRRAVRSGSVTTGAWRDWTVKVDPVGLEPGQSYWYRFEADGVRSMTGRTRTLPTNAERLRMAFTSCANWPFGYFNVYGHMATRADLDLVLHLGDYLYEYGNGTYGDGSALGRLHEPDREIITLDHYRTRYAQYRTDPHLQALHRQHPLIPVWDDHEFANNAWRAGAENHDEGEGRWSARRAAASRAWHEWLPARDLPMERRAHLWRSFPIGGLADLVMLDTRLYGRDRQASTPEARDVIDNPERSLLGPAQEAWFLEQLSASAQANSTWRLVGQQVMFGQLGGFGEQPIRNVDQWDGYAPARQRVFDHLAAKGIDNTVIMTGDIHSSWAMDLAPQPFSRDTYDPDTGRGARAVELVTPSVTSPAYTDGAEAERAEKQALAAHPHMHWVDLLHHGYVLLDVNRDRLQAEWWFSESIKRREAGERFAAAFATHAGANHLTRVERPSPPRGDAPPLAN